MPGLSKVIVLDPDVRASRQIQLGFAREGVATTIGEVPADFDHCTLPEEAAGLVVVGGKGDRALTLIARARSLLNARQLDASILFSGGGVLRAEAVAAGADEVLLHPAFLRDVVTIGRLLCEHPAGERRRLSGSLVEVTGVYTLIRALSALGRSAVLTLIRGLRRGEIRFYSGEITSAQVGLIHGQAALHQLLLWSDAKFDFRHEDIVRRQQIPLTRDELFADAERFLDGVRDASGRLSPSMVLEQDTARVHKLGAQVPTEVHGVLRMFDGHRVLADVLEDSPYRVFETLRVAQRAVEVGLLRPIEAQKPKTTRRAVLAIEEWLAGGNRDEVLARTASDTGPVAKSSPVRVGKGSRRERKHRRANTPPAVPVTATTLQIDWGPLIPRVVGAEVGSLSGVIPAALASGEIQSLLRDAPREKLEALMDTDRRETIFSKDLGIEPNVVFDQDADHAAAAKLREDAESRAAVEDARLRAEAAEWARTQAQARVRAEEDRAREAAELARRLADAKVRSEAEARAKLEAELHVEDTDRTPIIRATAELFDSPATDDRATDLVKQLLADKGSELKTPPVIVAETPTTTVAVQETMTVRSTQNTARLTSISTATITESAPMSAIDEPSDGVVRQISFVDTAPAIRGPLPGVVPSDDRPDPAKGEISTPRARPPTLPPDSSEPSILVTDLAAVQSAIAAVINAQADAPPSDSVASSGQTQVISHVRTDAASGATAFSAADEAFFRAGQDKATKHAVPVETFDDLDEGYQPQGFWDRLRGKPSPRSRGVYPPTPNRSPNMSKSGPIRPIRPNRPNKPNKRR